jgi:hypothetical protein
MKAMYIGNKTYSLLNDRDHTLATLTYTGFLCKKAVLSFPDEKPVNITPDKWGSSIVLSTEKESMGKLTMKWWKMNMEINVNGKPTPFRLQRAGLWKKGYVLVDNDQTQRVKITPCFRWKTMRYDYDLEVTPGQRYVVDPAILLLCVYCANYLYTASSAA